MIESGIAGEPAAAAPDRVARTLLWIPAAACAASLTVTAVFLLWSSNRGLDITDEGMYVLSARWPGDVGMSTSGGAMLAALPFRLLHWNIAAFRIAGFAGVLLSGAILFAGLHALRARLSPGSGAGSWPERVAEASAIAVATFLGYCWLLTTPSYNSITSCGLYAGAGAVLTAFARHEQRPRAADRWMVIAGACLGFVFFAKFTAAICAGALFAAVALCWPLAAVRVRLRWIGDAALGVLPALTVYFAFLQSPSAWLAMVRTGFWGAATLSPLHGSGALARYYANWRDDVMAEILKGEWRLLLALAVLAMLLLLTGRDRWRGGRSVRIAVWLTLGYASYAAVEHLRAFPPSLYAYDVVRKFFRWMLVLTLPAIAWHGLRRSDRVPSGVRRAWLLIALLLFALPFCGAIGTGNPIHITMRYTLAPWFGLFALVLGLLSSAGRTRWPVPVGLACLSASCAFYVIEGALYAPYRLLTPLPQQTHVTEVGVPASPLLLDAELSAFIRDVRRVAVESGFKPGDDILGFYDMPGIVYALGGRSPGIPWYSIGHPGSQLVMERGLELIGPARAGRAFLLQTASSTAWLQTLGRYGIRFPQDYVLCGTLTIPFSWKHEEVKWWRPARK